MSDTLMEKMLGLPEFEVTDFKQNDNDMGFYVETKERPTVCPVCGCYKPNLVIYKSRKQTVRDIMLWENAALLSSTGITTSAVSAADALPNRWRALGLENGYTSLTNTARLLRLLP